MILFLSLKEKKKSVYARNNVSLFPLPQGNQPFGGNGVELGK
jgi:hypothetical protein